MACTQQELDDLIAERARLRHSLSSPVLEIEQPALGRTQYRSVEEMERQLRYVEQQIAACIGMVDASSPEARRLIRRPLYPTVREV